MESVQVGFDNAMGGPLLSPRTTSDYVASMHRPKPKPFSYTGKDQFRDQKHQIQKLKLAIAGHGELPLGGNPQKMLESAKYWLPFIKKNKKSGTIFTPSEAQRTEYLKLFNS